jgi:hypothetical protein
MLNWEFGMVAVGDGSTLVRSGMLPTIFLTETVLTVSIRGKRFHWFYRLNIRNADR